MAIDTLLTQIAEAFKAKYGLKITDGVDLMFVERNLLEFMMLLGRSVMAEVFQGIQNGYEGPIIEANGREYRFVDYRWTRSWVSRNGTHPAVSTFSPPSQDGRLTIKAWSIFTRYSLPMTRS